MDAAGITLSPAQEALASQRIVEDGLGEHCRAELRDYRDLPNRAVFDKVASVGMFEHVGRSRLRNYFGAAYRVLRPGGLLLNSGIIDLEGARPVSLRVRAGRRLRREGRFLQRYIFPDGELLPLADVVRAAEARRREAIALVGEATFRAWRLYLAASANAFATGRIGDVQLLLAKPCADGSSDTLLTRDDLYRAERRHVRTWAWRARLSNRVSG